MDAIQRQQYDSHHERNNTHGAHNSLRMHPEKAFSDGEKVIYSPDHCVDMHGKEKATGYNRRKGVDCVTGGKIGMRCECECECECECSAGGAG